MINFTHTVLVNDDDDLPEIKADQLWTILEYKSRNPVLFVPSITKSEVIDDAGDQFVRRIVVRGAITVRERVLLEPHRRIVFEQLDSPYLTTIVNEMGEDDRGRLTFTLIATLSAPGIERSRRESGFVAENEAVFFDTARATVNSIRLYAAAHQPELA
ncbi:AtaL-like protein [Micromonospora sp. NPDC049523]|uniref:AtaL-like protein n=1 Tax=Micromonospora sp. NPDC049523 TaxID=3155921 RepID=UPI003417D9C3